MRSVFLFELDFPVQVWVELLEITPYTYISANLLVYRQAGCQCQVSSLNGSLFFDANADVERKREREQSLHSFPVLDLLIVC